MFGELLCRLGLHRFDVEEIRGIALVEFYVRCLRCKKEGWLGLEEAPTSVINAATNLLRSRSRNK